LLAQGAFADGREAFAQGDVVFLFEDDAIQAEFFLYFLMPLFAQVGRGDDKNAAFALCPVLQDDEASFDGLPSPTSSARMTPRSSGFLQAKRAAST